LAAFTRPPGPRMLLSDSQIDALDERMNQNITISAANCMASRQCANALLNERYSWRGYEQVHLPTLESMTHLPLTASQDGEVIGTLTLAIDSPAGLNCDRAFGEEVDYLRAKGAKLCEFTKLAVDSSFGNDQVLAAMFHVAYLAADSLADCDTLLMEVNPRHVRYYVRMLGAQVIGGQRSNASVNAPAVLLSMAFSDVRRRIDERAGNPRPAGEGRSLYSLFFSRDEERAIVSRFPDRMSCGDTGSSFGFRLPQAHVEAAPVHH
ncbi:MAG: hypothetical protein ABIN96_17265, partial [Rubrivivax sp.]